jgi:hypothetical protein
MAPRQRGYANTSGMGFKAATWTTVWIFPLRSTTPIEVVRQAESRVATLVGGPAHNHALPQRPARLGTMYAE